MAWPGRLLCGGTDIPGFEALLRPLAAAPGFARFRRPDRRAVTDRLRPLTDGQYRLRFHNGHRATLAGRTRQVDAPDHGLTDVHLAQEPGGPIITVRPGGPMS
jgi:hypothetical protein